MSKCKLQTWTCVLHFQPVMWHEKGHDMDAHQINCSPRTRQVKAGVYVSVGSSLQGAQVVGEKAKCFTLKEQMVSE